MAPGDEPHHLVLGDNEHGGTVASGLIANYFIGALAAAGITIAPFTDQEILANAGIAPPRPDTAAPSITLIAPSTTAIGPSSTAAGAGTVCSVSVGEAAPSEPSNETKVVVQHAPAFIMDAMLHSMQRETDRTVHLGAKDMAIEEGHVYLAPGDHHMQVSANSRKLEINQGPPENYVRPAADPLFRSAARAFGSKVVAVVLTGPGRDGSHGCAEVRLAGGRILVQDPATAVAPPMPRSVIEAGLADEVVPLAEIGRAAALALSSLGSRVRV